MEIMVYLWIAIATFCLMAELGHPGLFFFLACSVGALGAAVCAFYSYPLAIHYITFLAVGCIALFVLKRIVKKSSVLIATNTQALIGKKGVVIVPLEPLGVGQVKIQGEVWSVRSHNEQPIACSEKVEVLAIKGCHLIVKKISERN
jgi:membrane protein implicated in regulation of membrane protease activity